VRKIRPRLTYANVTATLALFIALGGASAFAATQLGKNTVGSKQLKKNAVTTVKIKNQAVTGAKIKNGSLTGTQIDSSTLGTVPSAKAAQTAQTATVAAGLAPPEPWHEVGTAGEPRFLHAWHNVTYEANAQTVAFYKDQLGVVHLRGIALGGSSAIFELPPGFRPASGKTIQVPIKCSPCPSNIGIGTISGSGFIPGADGAVEGSGSEFNFLEGIAFRAES
jgi:hypothetical protein